MVTLCLDKFCYAMSISITSSPGCYTNQHFFPILPIQHLIELTFLNIPILFCFSSVYCSYQRVDVCVFFICDWSKWCNGWYTLSETGLTQAVRLTWSWSLYKLMLEVEMVFEAQDVYVKLKSINDIINQLHTRTIQFPLKGQL